MGIYSDRGRSWQTRIQHQLCIHVQIWSISLLSGDYPGTVQTFFEYESGGWRCNDRIERWKRRQVFEAFFQTSNGQWDWLFITWKTGWAYHIKRIESESKKCQYCRLQLADLMAHAVRRYGFKTIWDLKDDRTTFSDKLIEILTREKFSR